MTPFRRLSYGAPLLLLVAAATSHSEQPAYTESGALVVPSGNREWVFMSSGIDMSYKLMRAARNGVLFAGDHEAAAVIAIIALCDFRRHIHYREGRSEVSGFVGGLLSPTNG